MHGHHEQQVDFPQIRDRALQRSRGIQDDARTDAGVADGLEGLFHLVVALDVDGEVIHPRVGEGLDEILRVRHHEMAVKWDLRERADGRHDPGPHREVRDKVSIHDVDVEHVGPRAHGLQDLLPEAVESRGEDRGGDLDGHRIGEMDRPE